VTGASLAAAVRHRTAAFVLLVGAAWGGWEATLRLTAPGRLHPALRPALQQPAPVDVVVTLGFAPEDFHIRLFQGYGVVSGVQGTTVLVNRVRPDDVHRIARYYWVRRIAPQP
jgi:hypothetical protein